MSHGFIRDTWQCGGEQATLCTSRLHVLPISIAVGGSGGKSPIFHVPMQILTKVVSHHGVFIKGSPASITHSRLVSEAMTDEY